MLFAHLLSVRDTDAHLVWDEACATLTTPLPRPKLDLLSAARAVFRKANDLQGRSIEGWNDNPARTKKDVIEGFQKAIKLAA